jgi:branched-chain amino acid transport system substrate-binding protein
MPILPSQELVSPSQWSVSASVDLHGRVEETDSARGARQLRTLERVIQLARALLLSGKDAVRCIWVAEDSTWQAVKIERCDAYTTVPTAEVSLQKLEPTAGISLRELDVLTLLAAGLSNEVVAQRLGRSPRTVAKHVEHLFEKLQVWTRAGLASFAVDQGLLRFPTPGGCQGLALGSAVLEGLIDELDSQKVIPPVRLQRRPLYIGIPYSAEGRGSADSQEMLNGAQLAIEEINSRGGVLGRELALVTSSCDPSDTRSMSQALEQLVNCEVDGITSAYTHPQALLSDLLSDYGAPLLHSLTMECAVEPVRQEPLRLGNLFQVNASDITYGVGLARFLKQIIAEKLWAPSNRKIVIVQPF